MRRRNLVLAALTAAATLLSLPFGAALAQVPQSVTIKTDVVTGEGSGQVFLGPVTIPLTDPILVDPFTGEPFINEVRKDVTCEDLTAGTDVVIFNCRLHKNIKYKTALPVAITILPNVGIQAVGDVVHTTLWIDFAGKAEVPGAEPGDDVQLEGFTVNQSLRPENCIDVTVNTTLLEDVLCSTLEEKDVIVVTFKTTSQEQIQLEPDPAAPSKAGAGSGAGAGSTL